MIIVYLLAGLSKRFGGKPKGLARIGPNNETLLEYSIKQALPINPTKLIFVVSNQTKELFAKEFKNSYKGIPIKYALQEFDSKIRDKPWGTCDALCSASSFIDSPFILCNGDDIYGERSFKILAEHIKNKEESATLGYELGKVLSDKGDVNRGIFQTDKNGFVKSIVEVLNLNKSNLKERGLKEESLCSMNIFAFSESVLSYFKEILADFKKEHANDRTAECFLPNSATLLIKSNKLKMKVYPTQDKWIGLTRPEDEEEARNELKTINHI